MIKINKKRNTVQQKKSKYLELPVIGRIQNLFNIRSCAIVLWMSWSIGANTKLTIYERFNSFNLDIE